MTAATFAAVCLGGAQSGQVVTVRGSNLRRDSYSLVGLQQDFVDSSWTSGPGGPCTILDENMPAEAYAAACIGRAQPGQVLAISGTLECQNCVQYVAVLGPGNSGGNPGGPSNDPPGAPGGPPGAPGGEGEATAAIAGAPGGQ